MSKKPFTWSFSSLNTYETCPQMFKSKYIDKTYVEPPQEHLIHGTTTHAHLEARMRDKTPLPEGYEHHEKWCVTLEKLPQKILLVEHKMGLTRDLQPTGFFSPDTWWRGVIDLAIIEDKKALICDWKTSKKAKPDFTQLNLFSAAVFTEHPEVETIKQMFIWLKLDKHSSEDFTRSGVQAFWQKMLPRVQRMEHSVINDAFFERPSGLCRGWCYHPTCIHRQDKKR